MVNEKATRSDKRCTYRLSVKALVYNDSKDKFLICRHTEGFWDIPGGGLEHGPDPKEDLSREIFEEMGLILSRIEKKPIYFCTGRQFINKDIIIANIVFECGLQNFDFVPSKECTEIKFVDQNDMKGIVVSECVKDLALAIFDNS